MQKISKNIENNERADQSSVARRAVLASAIDHSAVLRGTERLADTTLHLVPVDAGGRVDSDALVQTMQQQPAAVVCLQWANNELGTLQDLAHLIPLIRSTDPDAFILIDARQGMGKEPCQIHEWQALGADFIAASAHKFGGPRGVGVLWHRVGLMIASQINGGRQQDDRRSGTEDLAGVCATVAALQAAQQDTTPLRDMLHQMVATIRSAIPQVVELAADVPRLGNTVNLACPGLKAQALHARLDLAGVAVSVSACMARHGEPSHVVAALPIDPALKGTNIRISIGHSTTTEDLQHCAAAYIAAAQAMLAR